MRDRYSHVHRWERLAFLSVLFLRPFWSSLTFPLSDAVAAGALLFLFGLLCLCPDHRERMFREPLILLGLCLFLAGLLGIVRSSAPQGEVLTGFLRVAQWGMGFFIARALLPGTSGLTSVIQVILLTAVFHGINAHWQVTGDLKRLEEEIRQNMPDLAANKDFMQRILDNAAFSTFFYPNALAGYCAMVLGLGIGGIGWSKNWKDLLLPVAGILGALTGLVSSKSEGGYLALAAGAMCAGFCAWRRCEPRIQRWVAGVFLGSLALAGLFSLSAQGLAPLLGRLYHSLDFRAGYWAAGLRMIADHPILGLGFGGYEVFVESYLPLWAPYARNPHSLPLQLWIELGVAGFLAALGLAAISVRRGLLRWGEARTSDRAAEFWILTGILSGLSAFAVHSLGEVDLVVTEIMFPVSVLLGVLSSDPVQGKKS